jgi:hypothetical protein
MAVELCKVSLWMEALEPGLPLSFLDSHIQHGNSLLGATPALLDKGIPDAAWEPLEGDDKKAASALKKRNKTEFTGQRTMDSLFATPVDNETTAVTQAVSDLESAADSDVALLHKKETQWQGILDSPAYRHQRAVADAWCAAFVWPKQAGLSVETAPTNGVWCQLRDGQGVAPFTVETTALLAKQFHFFHWHLQFPHVFAKGGFDVVLGNPPWDSILFREEEFFAATRPDISQAPTAAVRKRMIAKLSDEDPILFRSYKQALRTVEGINSFVRSGVRFPLCGVGRVNLFALFAEAARSLVCPSGRVGQILPSGIVADDSTKLYFQSIVDRKQLVSFFDFENREGLFPSVHRSFKFGVLTLCGGAVQQVAQFLFFATQVEHLKEPDRRFTLSAEDIALLNPETKTCPIFRSRRDAEIAKSIYRRLPVLIKSGWEVELRRLLNSADDSANFVAAPGAGLIPLYEGKYFHHYDHRWVTHEPGGDRALSSSEQIDACFSIRPRYFYPEQDARQRFGVTWRQPWVVAWRDITNSTNERTMICSVIPSLAVPDTAKVVFLSHAQVPLTPTLVANLCAVASDFVSRQKVGGTHMSAFIVEQIPVLPPATYAESAGWDRGTVLRDWILPRVLELTYTAWDLESFAKDVGHDGPPFRWDAARRFLLRAELDAAFFHLYGIARDDVDYVMDTFPIVRRNDEKAHGEYRTKRVILEIYDAMSDAAQSGHAYQTRLDPPPADPRIAHPKESRRSP